MPGALWRQLAFAVLIPMAALCVMSVVSCVPDEVGRVLGLPFMATMQLVGTVGPGVIVGRAVRRQRFWLGMGAAIVGWIVGVVGACFLEYVLIAVVPGYQGAGQGILWLFAPLLLGLLCSPITGIVSALVPKFSALGPR